MKRVLVIGALVLVALLAGGCGGSHRSSGCELIFRAVPTRGQSVTPAGMQLASQITMGRLAKIGVSSPSVSVKDGNEIVIRFSGANHPAGLAELLGETGRLQLFDFEPSLAAPSVLKNQQPSPLPSLYALLKPVQTQADETTPDSYYLFKKSASHQIVHGPAPNLHQLFSSYKGGKQPAGTQVLKVPAGREPVRCAGRQNCPGASKRGESWYLLKLPPALNGKDLVESGISQDVDPNSGQPIVTLQFTHAGSQAFRRITEAEYNRGRVNAGEAGRLDTTNPAVIGHYAARNAIVLDGELEETPYIDYTDPSLSQGIVGNAQIAEPSIRQARRTALVLQSGSLPYTFAQAARSSCSRQ